MDVPQKKCIKIHNKNSLINKIKQENWCTARYTNGRT